MFPLSSVVSILDWDVMVDGLNVTGQQKAVSRFRNENRLGVGGMKRGSYQ